MQSNTSNSVEDLRSKLREAGEEQKRLERLLYIEELRAKLQASEEEQKNLQEQIQQAEHEDTNTPAVIAKPVSEETVIPHVAFQENGCQDVGGPDCETPRVHPKPEETQMVAELPSEKVTMQPTQKATKSRNSNPTSGFLKLRSKTHAEDKMVLNLDLDSPALDESGNQRLKDALASVEDLLAVAAQRVVGPDTDAMVEAEVIGACAFAPVSASDSIDVLCKISEISTPALFTVFRQMLHADPAASGVREHPEVFTGSPMSGLRFTYAKFQFRVFLAKVPWDEEDQETFRSLNGCLVARSLTEIMSTNSSFGQALRMVKFWAKSRGIYGQACGFPGGVTWSLCLGRVCQMYPNANAAELVVRFFKVYSSWNWQTAVALVPLDGSEDVEYDPVPEGTIAVMTPGGSPINTAAHVKTSELPVLQVELKRAYKICKRIGKGQSCWSDLYALPSISNKRKHYLRLEFVAQTQAALELLVEWGEVCLPVLLAKFEQELPNVQATAWSHQVAFQHESYAFACSMFIGLRFTHGKDQSQQTIDLRIPTVGFLEMMDMWPHKEHFAGQYDTMLQHMRREELQQWCELCSDKYEERKQLSNKDSDSQSDATTESKEYPEQVNYIGPAQFSLQRWSDGIDDYTGICGECY